jgi:hypothetical protein
MRHALSRKATNLNSTGKPSSKRKGSVTSCAAIWRPNPKDLFYDRSDSNGFCNLGCACVRLSVWSNLANSCDELQRRAGFTPPAVARIPCPRDAETSAEASASAAHCRLATDNRLDQSSTADLFAKSKAATAPRLTKSSTLVTRRLASPDHLIMREPGIRTWSAKSGSSSRSTSLRTLA